MCSCGRRASKSSGVIGRDDTSTFATRTTLWVAKLKEFELSNNRLQECAFREYPLSCYMSERKWWKILC